MSVKRPKWAEWADWIRAKDDFQTAGAKPEALADLVVLDLSSGSYAGAYCSSMLAEFGAEVIRIEPPGGDFLRTCSPYGMEYKGEGINYLTEGRNKYHVTLDLDHAEGREIFKGLAAQADVLIETFAPGGMDGWGLGYEQLKEFNPRLIFASITTYGQFGPDCNSRMPDYDNVAQARSGIQYATGGMLPEDKSQDQCPWAVPTKASPWIAWCTAGTFMATGILAALHWRMQSGEGQALCAWMTTHTSGFKEADTSPSGLAVWTMRFGSTALLLPRTAGCFWAVSDWRCGKHSAISWASGTSGEWTSGPRFHPFWTPSLNSNIFPRWLNSRRAIPAMSWRGCR